MNKCHTVTNKPAKTWKLNDINKQTKTGAFEDTSYNPSLDPSSLPKISEFITIDEYIGSI